MAGGRSQQQFATQSLRVQLQGGLLQFGSVTLQFGGGTVRVVPVVGSGGSSAKGFPKRPCRTESTTT